MSLKEKKISLFKRFSMNLRTLNEEFNLRYSINPDKDLYVCPLSLNQYDIEILKNTSEEQLSLEHSPPESLKGTPVCLTSKQSNDRAGHDLDIYVLNHLKQKNLDLGIPLKLKFRFDDKKNISGTIVKTNKNTFNLDYYPTNGNKHKGIDEVDNIIKNKFSKNESVKIKLHLLKNDLRYKNIGLLKTAYLIAFNHFGYALIFNSTGKVNQNYQKIRDQISNPNKEIIKEILVFYKTFPDNLKGVNLIKSPKKYRSILIVFDLVLDSISHRIGVFLPIPSKNGFHNINRLLLEINSIPKLEVVHIQKQDISKKDGSLFYYKLWNSKLYSLFSNIFKKNGY